MAAQLLTLWLAVTLALMTLSTRRTDAIHCYECNSATNAACADPFKNSSETSVVKCQGTTCTKGKGTSSGTTVVVRECSNEVVEKDQCVDVTVQGITTRVCACSHDFCNAAAGLYATALWAAGAAAAALYSARR